VNAGYGATGSTGALAVAARRARAGRLAERGGGGDLGPVQLVEARSAQALAVKPFAERGGGDIAGIWLPGRSGSRSLLGEVPR